MNAKRTKMKRMVYEAVVVGGGAAGVGISIALKDAGLENFIVLERSTVGSSFETWPAETRFITPSFATNSVGMLDLNSVAIGTSPAYSLEVEHPTGAEYAAHLGQVARYGDLPIREMTNVLRITKPGDEFVIETEAETLRARHVVWAAGEFQYPSLNGFKGSELCRHTATIDRYADLEGEDFLIIGGFESGIDAAYHLASRDKRVHVFDRGCPWEDMSSDPSLSLSTFSIQRMRESCFTANVELHPNTQVTAATRAGLGYELEAMNGRRFKSEVQPILAGGFEGSHKLVMHLFDQREDGYPILSEHDESTRVPGLFLCGPSVRHDGHVFCFILKFRMRFAVVAKAIATSLGLPATKLDEYRRWGMYLDDLSCCGGECAC